MSKPFDEAPSDFDTDSSAPEPATSGALGIGVIARELGLTKDTLRVWERRYGFPQPLRLQGGERVYPTDQITRLKIVKRLLDGGHRPGKVVQLPLDALRQLAGSITPTIGTLPDEALEAVIEQLARGEVGEVRRMLAQRLLSFGIGRFVIETAAPLATSVGDAWGERAAPGLSRALVQRDPSTIAARRNETDARSAAGRVGASPRAVDDGAG
ncbi:MAG: MerR family transcriptional regulator [Pararobbsia sp.]